MTKSPSAGYISGKETCDSRAGKRPRGRRRGVLTKSDKDRSGHRLCISKGQVSKKGLWRGGIGVNETRTCIFAYSCALPRTMSAEVYISIDGVRLRLASQIKTGAGNSHGGSVSVYVQKYDKRAILTPSTSIAAPGLSAYMSSPHRLPLTLAAGVRVRMVIGSCVGCGNANGILSTSS